MTPLSSAFEHSVVAGFARSAKATARASFCYRWLTAETEPEVIVIDLRETYSVGPVIALLDRSLDVLVPASRRSTTVGTVESAHQSVTAAPVRMASFVLGFAVLTNLVFTFIVGDPTQAGVAAQVSLLGLAAFGTRVSMTWDELAETKPVKLLIAALEPPAPSSEEVD